MLRPALLACALAAALPAGAARAQDAAPALPPLDLQARIDFLEQRFDAGRTYAQAWQYGWSGANVLGIGYGAYQALTLDSFGGKVAGGVNAIKSVLGLVNLLQDPLPGLEGGDPIRAPRNPADRLRVGEALLRRADDRANYNYTFGAYRSNLIINAVAGATIAAAGHMGDALVSSLGGFTLGAIQTLSEPTRATTDLRDYETRFGATRAAGRDGLPPARIAVSFSF